MKSHQIKQKNILESYEEKWVALSPNGKKVIAAASSIKTVNKRLDKLGDKDAVLTFVLPFNKSFSP